MAILKQGQAEASVETPDSGYIRLFLNSATGAYGFKDSSGTFHYFSEGLTREEVEDLLQSSFIDTASITWNYNDASNGFEATVQASGTEVARIAGSTYFSVQHLQDVFHSTGHTSGGNFTVNGDGTIDVSAGTGLIRATNNDLAELKFTDWSAVASLALVDQDLNYIYVEYNAGSPQVISTTTKRTDYQTNIFLGTVYRDGLDLHETEETRIRVSDHAALMVRRMNDVNLFAHVSGGGLSEPASRKLRIEAVTFWVGLNKISLSAFDTNASDTFRTYHRDGLGDWTETVSQTLVNNTQYDDGSGTLATLTDGKYGVHYVYRGIDGDTYVIYGQGDYALNEAEGIGSLDSTPFHFEGHAAYYGKLVIAKNGTSFIKIQSAFDDDLTLLVDHDDLLNKGTNTHAVIDQHIIDNTGDEVQATETVAGIAEIATQAEVDAGTDDTRIITPLKLEARMKQSNLTQEINVQTGTSYTLVDADHGKMITLDNAATITLNVNTGLRSDFACVILQKGVGQVNITGTATLNEYDGLFNTAGQWAVATIQHLGSNSYIIQGRLS